MGNEVVKQQQDDFKNQFDLMKNNVENEKIQPGNEISILKQIEFDSFLENELNKSDIVNIQHSSMQVFNSRHDNHFYCYFHSEYKITNFCKNKTCNKPLCPECIASHTKTHIQNKEEIEYDTIENVIEKTAQQIKQTNKKVQENLESLYNIKAQSQVWEQRLDNNLEVLRNKYYYQVDRLISRMKQEYGSFIENHCKFLNLEQEQNKQIDNFLEQSEKLQQILQSNIDQMENSEKKLFAMTSILNEDLIKLCQQQNEQFKKFQNTIQSNNFEIILTEQSQDQILNDLIKYQAFAHIQVPETQIQNYQENTQNQQSLLNQNQMLAKLQNYTTQNNCIPNQQIQIIQNRKTIPQVINQQTQQKAQGSTQNQINNQMNLNQQRVDYIPYIQQTRGQSLHQYQTAPGSKQVLKKMDQSVYFVSK